MTRALVVLAVVAVAAVGLTATPAAAATGGEVTVEQADDGTVTVTVTHNGSAVTDATVTVESTDENTSYAGEGEYSTDENGTVELPAPGAGVNVSITATYESTSTEVAGTLYPPADGDEEDESEEAAGEESAFGQLVSQFVHEAQNDTDGGIGPAVAGFVLENNPAAEMIPDHAGPPTDAGPGSAGPPGHAGGEENETQRGGGFRPVDVGPPDDAGPPVDRGGGDGGDGGPPEHAGPPEE